MQSSLLPSLWQEPWTRDRFWTALYSASADSARRAVPGLPGPRARVSQEINHQFCGLRKFQANRNTEHCGQQRDSVCSGRQRLERRRVRLMGEKPSAGEVPSAAPWEGSIEPLLRPQGGEVGPGFQGPKASISGKSNLRRTWCWPSPSGRSHPLSDGPRISRAV